MKKQLFCILMCLTMLLAGCGAETAVPETTQAPQESAQTEAGLSDGLFGQFTTVDLAGNEVNQSVLKDYGLTMINAWATYCGPCLMEMPDLGELAAEYEDKGVQIIGLVLDVWNYDGTLSQEQLELAQSIVDTTGANYLHMVLSTDMSDLLPHLSAVPTTFFVDSQGNQVGQTIVGSRSKADWTDILEEVLAEVS